MKYLCGIALVFLAACTSSPEFDIVLRNGMIYDGSGSSPYEGDIAINADTIAAMGELKSARGKIELDAGGLAIAPGFINMLSWAGESLIEDGHSQSNIRQGVTLEVMGEGWSGGPRIPPWKRKKLQNRETLNMILNGQPWESTWSSL